MELKKEDIARLIGMFRAEALDLIESITEAFLSLESCQANDRKGLMQSASRDAHTMKGAAATIGFERVVVITHHLESVLEKLKTEDQPAAAETIDSVLHALDILKQTVQTSQPKEENLSEAETQLVQQLSELAGRSADTKTDTNEDVSSATSTGAASQPESKNVLTFRRESLEYLKLLAKSLHALKTSDEKSSHRLLEEADEKAIELINLAESMQHQPVLQTTRLLSEALEGIQRNQIRVDPIIANRLLKGLTTILKATEKDFDDETPSSDEDKETIHSLLELKENAVGTVDRSEVFSSEIQQSVTRQSGEPQSATKRRAEKKDSVPAKKEFVRISENKLDAVIAKVDELFETNLQIGSMLSTLGHLYRSIGEIENTLRVLKKGSQGLVEVHRLDQVIGDLHGLATQAKTATKKFDYDERLLSKLVNNVQKDLRGIRLAPVSTIYVALRRQVRKLSKDTDKPVELLLDGGEHAVDRRVLDAIEAPLRHIIRNAIDHGIEDTQTRLKAGKREKGTLKISTRHIGDAVELTVADDGRGIDHEAIRARLLRDKRLPSEVVKGLSQDQLLDYIFEPGFTTKGAVTQISGRGVGMDVVRHTVEGLGGEVRIESALGKGTRTTLRLPLAMSTLKCLLVKVANRIMAIPAHNVEKVIVPRSDTIRHLAGDEVVVHDDQNLPLRSIAEILGLCPAAGQNGGASGMAVVIGFGDRRIAFYVDDLVEYAQLILKPLGDLLERVPNVYGLSLLRTGEMALVLNPGDLLRSNASGRDDLKMTPSGAKPARSRRILVVDDSMATRILEKTLLEAAGFVVVAVSDGYQAMQALSAGEYDLVISDIQMPNMDGLELARSIKSRAELMHLPIILVSALGSDQDKSKGMAAGADAYIVKKDLSQADLVDTINQLL